MILATTANTDAGMAAVFVTFMAFAWLVFGLAFGAWARSIAAGKGRRGWLWFGVGYFTGLVGIIVLATLPRVVVYTRYQPPQSRKAQRARR